MSVTRKHLSVVAALTATVLLGFGLSQPAAGAETPSCASFDSEVYQRVRPATGANLLTMSKLEADRAMTRYGFTQDSGVVAAAAKYDGVGLVKIWRLYQAGDFVWAADGADADGLEAEGYTRQSVDFYAAAHSVSCLQPIYRLTRAGVHQMATTSQADSLDAAGWVREKVAFYARVGGATLPGAGPPPRRDTTFSLAVLPDTQTEVTRPADTRFKNRADWLVANKSALDLRYAIQVGDLVNWGNVEPTQFDKISAEIKPLEAAIPWSGAIGNHDTAAVCAGGGACPGADTHDDLRDTSAYNRAFPVSRFPQLQGTYAANRIDNAYQTFAAGEVDWLVLNLELWPRPAVVAWAQEVVKSHPRHNVIVVTHAYLESNGSISTSDGGYGDTSPAYLYDHLIKAYPNIKLVLSGHVGLSASRTDTGTAGNKILSVLQTFHSPANPVRIMQIDTAAGSVTSTVYAPETDESYTQYATSTSGIRFIK